MKLAGIIDGLKTRPFTEVDSNISQITQLAGDYVTDFGDSTIYVGKLLITFSLYKLHQIPSV